MSPIINNHIVHIIAAEFCRVFKLYWNRIKLKNIVFYIQWNSIMRHQLNTIPWYVMILRGRSERNYFNLKNAQQNKTSAYIIKFVINVHMIKKVSSKRRKCFLEYYNYHIAIFILVTVFVTAYSKQIPDHFYDYFTFLSTQTVK